MTLPDWRYATAMACALLFGCAREDSDESAVGAAVEQLQRDFELTRHEGLLAAMASAEGGPAIFTTDGCSGGLSVGWEHLAERIERVRELHGQRPPWEDCCVAHDRLYHAGPGPQADGDDSLNAREAADLALRACVLETGQERKLALSADYGVSTDDVEETYGAIATLMYQAVRVGGMPCTGLPWRWGYGWPECD